MARQLEEFEFETDEEDETEFDPEEVEQIKTPEGTFIYDPDVDESPTYDPGYYYRRDPRTGRRKRVWSPKVRGRRTTRKKAPTRKPGRVRRYLGRPYTYIRRRVTRDKLGKVLRPLLSTLGLFLGIVGWHVSVGGWNSWEIKRAFSTLLDFKFPNLDATIYRLTNPESLFARIIWGTGLVAVFAYATKYIPVARGVRKYMKYVTLLFSAIFIGTLIKILTFGSEKEYGQPEPPGREHGYSGELPSPFK